MKVVIIAGGKGTRISSVNSEIPKALIPVNGKPVLEYQIELAKGYGYTEFILIIGHLGQKIKDYFSNGSKWGVNIQYFEETEPLGTAGALSYLSDVLLDDFFVFYGDTVMDINLDKMLKFHKEKRADATLLLHPNDHPFDSDLVEVDDESKITGFISKPHPEGMVYRNLVNAALYILSPKVLLEIQKGKQDFGKDIFPKSLQSGLKLYGYNSSEYIKDMGTPERYHSVCDDVVSGKVHKMNSCFKRPAVFLDRDGVISLEVDLLKRHEQVELIEGAAEAISLINQKGYLAIVVTNQPVIARNLCTFEELSEIHKTLETKLGKSGAYLNAIYFCPHHPDSGYPEERKEFKIKCNCRKPAPGMLLQAAEDWNIDMSSSYMIGDRKSDVDAGDNAKVKQSFQIHQNEPNGLLNLIRQLL